MSIFSGTRGPRNARIMIVGESYGKNEHEQQKPFVGASGQDLELILNEVGVNPEEVFFTNVVNERPPSNDMKEFFYSNAEVKRVSPSPIRGLFPRANVVRGLDTLRQVIATVKPELIIGFGNYSLWALTDESFSISNTEGVKTPTGISSWRGSQLRTSAQYGSRKFLPTYHPAACLRTHSWRYMLRHDLRVRVPKALANDWSEPDYNFIVRPSFQLTTQFLEDTLCQLNNAPVKIVLDLETTEYHMISCCGLAREFNEAICIPFTLSGGRSYWSTEEEFIILKLLQAVLLHPNCHLRGQNLLFDLQYIANQFFCLPRVELDTMVAHHTIFPGGGDPESSKAVAQGAQVKALYNLSSMYCDHYYYWKEEGKIWDKHISEDQHWRYNCRDCVKTYEVADELDRLVNEFDLREQFTFQMRVMNDMLIPMMLRGVKRDERARLEAAFDLLYAQYEFDNYLDGFLPPELIPEVKSKKSAPWYASPKKQAILFYDFLGIKPKKNKAGNPTVDKNTLPILAQREPLIKPLVEKIEMRRSVGVYYSTFIEMEADTDGRIRCSYKLTGTDTFRLSSSENAFGSGGNLQNIPSGKETDIEIDFKFPNTRKLFVPDEGYEIAEFDLSGADAQVVAWDAEDEDLKSAFRQGLKLHIKNARDVYPELTRDMTDEELKALDHDGGLYHNCKRLVHGTNYGGSADGLAERVRVPVNDVREFQYRWFSLHPGIKRNHVRTEQILSGIRCWKCGELNEKCEPYCPHCNAFPQGRTIGNKFGYRIIYFDHLRDLFNKALAWRPQSTVAINCNKGAIALVDNLPWVELLLQTHDSLTVQYPIRYHDDLPLIRDALHSVKVPYSDELCIPWSCKISRSSWGECEQIKW